MLLEVEAGGAVGAQRPSLSPAVLLALSFWASAAAVFFAASPLEADVCAAGAVGCAAGVAVLAGLAAALRRRPAAVMAVAVLLGLSTGGACAFARAADLHDQTARACAQQARTFVFEAVSDSRETEFGSSCAAKVELEGGRVVTASVRYPAECGRFLFGEAFTAHARFSPLPEASYDYYREQGVSCLATVEEVERLEGGRGALGTVLGALAGVRTRLLSVFDGYAGDGAAFLRAVLFNDRSQLDGTPFYQDVKTVGLAHLIAVSGAHTSIVCALLGAALGRAGAPRGAVVPLQAGFLAAYLVCTGMPISGVRAAVMTAVSLVALYARRRASSLSALAVCVAVLVAVSPEAAVSLSFALSVLATLGIVLFGGLAREWFDALLRGRFPYLSDSLALTTSSSLLATPLSAAVFSQLPLISPLANVVATPFFAFFCAGGLGVSALAAAFPPVFSWLVFALVVAAQMFCDLICLLALVPFAAVPFSGDAGVMAVLSCAAAAMLWYAWPRPTGLARHVAVFICGGIAACLVAYGALAPRLSGTELVMLDVGQGDAILVRSEGATLLVDTGNQDAELLAGLAKQGVVRLDAVAITHPDDDHCASLSALRGVVSVGAVYVADDLLECPCASCTALREEACALVGEENLRGLSVGETLAVGALLLEVVWPHEFADEGGNGDSLSFRLESDIDGDGVAEWDALLVGDAEAEELRAMAFESHLAGIDVYKVGHHGSAAALTPELAERLSPKVALVGVGAQNRYGHPAPETLAALEGAGARVYRTDLHGAVTVRFEPDELVVFTESSTTL